MKKHTNRKKDPNMPVGKLKRVKDFFPAPLRELLATLPKPESDEEGEYQRVLRVLVQKKAERDVFPAFKQGETEALSILESLVEREKDESIRSVYQTLSDTYRRYLDFEFIGVNPHFIDPETGRKGVLPSLHQRIGAYYIIHERRFGIWDGGFASEGAL